MGEKDTKPDYYHNGKLYIEICVLKLYNNDGLSKEELMKELERVFSNSKLTLSSIKSIEETII